MGYLFISNDTLASPPKGNGVSIQAAQTPPGYYIELPKEKMVIGRLEPPQETEFLWLQLDHDSVSKRHCCTLCLRDHFAIQDLNSSSGIVVNNVRIGGATALLMPGDRIQIGKVKIEYMINLPAADKLET